MHLWSAVSLFLACLMQKELIKYLAIPASFKGTQLLNCVSDSACRLYQYPQNVGLLHLDDDPFDGHRVRYLDLDHDLTNLCRGYLMGPYSRLDNFSVFNVFFALPWVIFIFGTYFTAQSSTLWLHRLFGNMLFKGAMSVPFSRYARSFGSFFGFWPRPDLILISWFSFLVPIVRILSFLD